MKTIVLTGGGTAGHVTPHLALLPRLHQEGWVTHYIGSREGIERGMIQDRTEIAYHAISTGKLRRYFSWRNLSDPFRVLAGFFQAFGILGKLKPDIVFSKGGFVAVPVVAAAFLRRIPVLAHESDLSPGLANKISAIFAKKVATTFPECAVVIGKKGLHTGTPMRQELFSGDRQQGLDFAGFDGVKPVLLMMGGSQGAAAVNQALREALPRLLPLFDILHLTGRGKLDESLAGTPGYFQAEFVDTQLTHLLAASDYILSRAGATAIGEFLALHKPMLLVPYPKGASRGDQILNARNYEKRGLALVLPQDQLDADSLVNSLQELMEKTGDIKKAQAAAPGLDGSQAVLSLIDSLRKKKDSKR